MAKKINQKKSPVPENEKENPPAGQTGAGEEKTTETCVLVPLPRPHYGRGRPMLSAVRRNFLRALEASLGNATAACAEAGINRETFYRWMRSESRVNLIFRARVLKLRSSEAKLDFLEERLMRAAEQGNVQAITFALKSLGKDRGYAERAGELEQQLSLRAVARLEKVIELQVASDPGYQPDVRRFAELAADDFGVRAETVEREFVRRRGGKGEGETKRQRDKEKETRR